MTALFYLTTIAVLLLAGILSSIISKHLKIPNVLLLILMGLVLNGLNILEFGIPLSPVFLTSISIIALVMILFDSSSRLNLKTFDTLSFKAMKLAFIFLISNLVLLTIPTVFIFGIVGESLFHTIIIGLIFAALVSATDSGSVLVLLKGLSGRVTKLLQIESIVNTPLSVILPFIFLDLFYNVGTTEISSIFQGAIVPLLTQIVVGLGAGVLMGLLVFKIMRKSYSEEISPIAMITAALLTYLIAENLSGSGVIAVVALGLFFGNIAIKNKKTLSDFSYMFSSALEILVFILIGFSIQIPFTAEFFLSSIILFVIYLFIRWLSIQITFRKTYTSKEKMFMALNVSKGIAVAVVIFTLMTMKIPIVSSILPLVLIFMIYSIITATIAERFAYKFIDVKKP